MPMNLGFFFIRKPRVSQYNAVSTRPPSSQGTFSLEQGFSVSYTGAGAYSALLSITGKKFQTIIDETLDHSDNLTIEVIGRNIQELVDAINANTNYTSTIITPTEEDLCLLEGTVQTDINNQNHTVYYNREIEYMIETSREGKLGNCSISYKEEDFAYSGENSKWMIDEGFIYDARDITLESDGLSPLGNQGVQIQFFPAIDAEDRDINRSISLVDEELVRSLDSPISETTLSAAPILIDGTLELKINQSVQEEGVNYIVDYGIPAELRTVNPSPYVFNSTNNIFRIRHNSLPMQEFVLPLGTTTSRELVELINQEASGFEAYSFLDDETRLEYFSVKADRGTYYHQLRIEDGSANATLGYTDQLASKGEANGKLLFMTHVPEENITPIERTSSASVNAIETATDNPFLGIYKDNFKLQENGEWLEKDKDFLVTDSGVIQLVEEIEKEDLVSGILTQDNALFPDSYNVYANGNKLEVDVDYRINPQGGWITLMTSAFPGHVYTADYKHKTQGIIEGEVLLGERAVLESTLKAPYSIPIDNFNFLVSVNNGASQSFDFPIGNGVVIDDVISTINMTATGFEAYQSESNVLALRTLQYGPKHTLAVLDGSFNSTVGFEDFYSTSGSGAEGGEQALQTAYTPMEIGGFTAPSGGDTIIIKNNDITGRYSPGTMIKLLNDYYQIRSTYLEERANLINNIAEPYTVIESSNDTFKFTIDDNEETKVTFDTGTGIDIDAMVAQINLVYPNSCKAMFVNGTKRLQLFGDSFVKIGEGNANRTLGFESNLEDTNTPDTFLFTTSLFKTIYVNPTMYTTVTAVPFIEETATKIEVPQNTNEITFYGNIAARYQSNIVIRLNNKYFYTVKSSVYDDDVGTTLVSLTSKIDVAILTDTSIAYTPNPIISEGDVKLKTNLYPTLTEPYSLYKNETLLAFEDDYEISDMGDIELNTGLVNGDSLYINYFGKRFIEAGTPLIADYTFFDFLRKGSNIKIGYQADNPDNFYLNVIHATTLMDSFQEEATAKIQQTANSSSTGFPTGKIPVTTNAESGNGSFEYDLGDLDDKIVLTQIWYDYFDDRIEYFENEKKALKGFKIGAEDGRLTQTQIENSADNPPTRLFPSPDTRPEEEMSEPVRLPCLFGYNQNDEESGTQGWDSDHISKRLSDELSYATNEKTKLNQLLLKSTSVGSTASTGNFDIYGSEQMQLYVERNSGGNLIQTNHTVTFTEKFDTTTGGGGGCILDTGPVVTHRPNTASEIASTINSQVGIGVASSSGSTVYLNSNTSVPCVFVVVDAPSVGFGTNADASVRSRSPWWTGGYTYSLTVPGSYSVHLDITNQNDTRTNNNSKHTDQIQSLLGIMEEWLPPLEGAFTPAKVEKNNAEVWISDSSSYSSNSTSFDDIKSVGNGQVFSSIDDPAIINARIAEIDARLTVINSRINTTDARYNTVNATLTSESLFNQRYSWLTILTHRNNGYYADRKRAIDAQDKAIREAENASAALDSMGTFG